MTFSKLVGVMAGTSINIHVAAVVFGYIIEQWLVSPLPVKKKRVSILITHLEIQ